MFSVEITNPKPDKISKCGIINLDTQIGSGAHWVCYRNIDDYCECFDGFGLKCQKIFSDACQQVENKLFVLFVGETKRKINFKNNT